MDDHKAAAVIDWHKLCTVKELQHFVGFTNFYCHCIRSSVGLPSQSLLKGGKTKLRILRPQSSRKDQVQLQFSGILILRSILQLMWMPQTWEQEPFCLSDIVILLNSTHVHSISHRKKKYDIGKQDLLALKLLLENWRYWLKETLHPFLALTDHWVHLTSHEIDPSSGQMGFVIFMVQFCYLLSPMLQEWER